MSRYSNRRENNRQRTIRLRGKAQDKENWPTIEAKKAWMEDMRTCLLKGLEEMIDANFSAEEAAYVRRLHYYRWTRRDIEHDKSTMGLFLRGHDDFYHVINGFFKLLGLPRMRELRYGEERPTENRIAQLAEEHGMTVHEWIVHCSKVIDERNREAYRMLENR